MYVFRDDLSKLKYTTMCIKEALRLYTPGPFVAKLSSEDVMIHGYKIPKGTYIYTANIYMIASSYIIFNNYVIV